MRQLQARMKELGTEALEEQLQTAVENAERRSVPDFRLTRLASVSQKDLSGCQYILHRRCVADFQWEWHYESCSV